MLMCGFCALEIPGKKDDGDSDRHKMSFFKQIYSFG